MYLFAPILFSAIEIAACVFEGKMELTMSIFDKYLRFVARKRRSLVPNRDNVFPDMPSTEEIEMSLRDYKDNLTGGLLEGLVGLYPI